MTINSLKGLIFNFSNIIQNIAQDVFMNTFFSKILMC